MIPDLPDLAIVSTNRLILHEQHDAQRARPLIDSLRTEGVLRNPPIVAPLQDRSGRFMVLDGANRTTALRQMGVPHVLVQVVQPDDPDLNLKTWNHVTWQLESHALLEGVRSLPDIEVKSTDAESGYEALMANEALTLLKLPDHQAYTAHTAETKLHERVARLNALVDSYKDRAKTDRTSLRKIDPLLSVYPQLSGLVIFPHFSVNEVIYLAGGGHKMPSGITRFTVSPRVLHTNYALDDLSADKSLERKNQLLNRWIQERLQEKRVRYYAEPTFLFDE